MIALVKGSALESEIKNAARQTERAGVQSADGGLEPLCSPQVSESIESAIFEHEKALRTSSLLQLTNSTRGVGTFAFRNGMMLSGKSLNAGHPASRTPGLLAAVFGDAVGEAQLGMHIKSEISRNEHEGRQRQLNDLVGFDPASPVGSSSDILFLGPDGKRRRSKVEQVVSLYQKCIEFKSRDFKLILENGKIALVGKLPSPGPTTPTISNAVDMGIRSGDLFPAVADSLTLLLVLRVFFMKAQHIARNGGPDLFSERGGRL